MALSNVSKPTTSAASSTTTALSTETPLIHRPEQKTKSHLVFRNRVIDKKGLRNLIAWAYKEFGTSATTAIADELKDLGFHYATQAAVSISVDDLRIPEDKKNLLNEAEEEITRTEDRYRLGEITEVERHTKVIDTWTETNERLVEAVKRTFMERDPLNSVWMMANSGARGNMSQVRQLVGMRGLMANPQGEIIDLPIRTNFREGLTVTEYVISSYGARKGLVDTALRTADSGYLTRRLVDVAQDMIVRDEDCGTQRGVIINADERGRYQSKLVGRLTADNITQTVKVTHVTILGGELHRCSDKMVLKHFDKGILVQPGDKLQEELKSSSLALVQAVKVQQGSALLVSQLPQETWEVKPGDSLKVADGSWVEAATMLSGEIVSLNSGLVVVSESNGILHVSLLKGSLHSCKDKKALKRFEKSSIAKPGDTLIKNLTVNRYTYVRSVVSDQNVSLFLSEFDLQDDYIINTNAFPLLVKKNQWVECNAELSNGVLSSIAGIINTYPTKRKHLLLPRNAEISREVSAQLEAYRVKAVKVRSPLTCETPKSVCRRCYGWALAHNKLVDLGEAVGIVAAQSIGEPGTQLTMRTFHMGGVNTEETGTVRCPILPTPARIGIVSFGKQARVRSYRTPHGVNAYIAETAFQLTVASLKASFHLCNDKTVLKRFSKGILVQPGDELQEGLKASSVALVQAVETLEGSALLVSELPQETWEVKPEDSLKVADGSWVEAKTMLSKEITSPDRGLVVVSESNGTSYVSLLKGSLCLCNDKTILKRFSKGILVRPGDEELQEELKDPLVSVALVQAVEPPEGSALLVSNFPHEVEQSVSITPGSILYVKNGDDIKDDQVLCQIRSGSVKKSVEKTTKDVICDLAGQVKYDKEIQPREATDRQGNITVKAQKLGQLWVLSGDVYNLPPNAEPVVEAGCAVQAGDVLAESRLRSEYGGDVRLRDATGDSREVQIVTAKITIKDLKLIQESSHAGELWNLESDDGLIYRLNTNPGSKIGHGEVIAELSDERFKTQSGGLVKFSPGLRIKKARSAKHGFELSHGGTLLWIPQETHEINKDISLLMIKNHQKIETGTEVVKDIFSQTSGIVTVIQKNDILREITVRNGKVYYCDINKPSHKEALERFSEEGMLVNPGDMLIEGELTAESIHYVESVLDPSEGSPFLLLRPVEEFAIPDDAYVPATTSVKQAKGPSMALTAQQRLMFKDGELVKSVEPVELLRTQIILETSDTTPQMTVDVEVAPGRTKKSQRLSMVILENLLVRRDTLSDATHGSTHTELKIEDGKRVKPGQVIATTQILCKEDGMVQIPPLEVRIKKPGDTAFDKDAVVELSAVEKMNQEAKNVNKKPAEFETEPVRRLIVERESDTCNVVIPEGISVDVKPGERLVQGDTLVEDQEHLPDCQLKIRSGDVHLCQDKHAREPFRRGQLIYPRQPITEELPADALTCVEAVEAPEGPGLLVSPFDQQQTCPIHAGTQRLHQHGQWVEKGTELVATSSQISGVARITKKAHGQTVGIRSGQLVSCANQHTLECFQEGQLVVEGRVLDEGIMLDTLTLVESVNGPSGPMLLLSPVKEFTIPQEVYSFNQDTSLLVINGQWIEINTEIMPDIYSKFSGIVTIDYKEQELKICHGELQMCQEQSILDHFKEGLLSDMNDKMITQNATEHPQDLRKFFAVYVQSVDTPEGSALLLSPVHVKQFSIPEEIHVFGSDVNLLIADGEWIEPGTRLTEAPITSQMDGVAILTESSITILSGKLHLCDNQSILKRFRKGMLVNPGMIVVDDLITDVFTYVQSVETPQGSALVVSPLSQEIYQINRTQTPLQVQPGQYVQSGDMLARGLKTKRSGIVVVGEVHTTSPTSGVVEAIRPGWLRLRVGRPYMVSPESILHVRDGGLVQRGDALALLVFERPKTGDIVQGLPRIEELLEARRPRDAAVLCHSSGHVKLEIGEDEEVLVKIIEDQQGDDSYDIPSDRSMFGGSAKVSRLAPWDEDQHKTALLGAGELRAMMVKTLQDLCRRHGLKGYTQWKKPELCRRLERAGITAPPPALQDLKADQLIDLAEKLDPSGVQRAELLKGDFQQMTPAELEELSRKHNIHATTLKQKGKKMALIRCLEDAGVSMPAAPLNAQNKKVLITFIDKIDPSQQKRAAFLEVSFTDQSSRQLKQYCKDHGLKAYSKLSKPELCAALEKAGVQAPPRPLENLDQPQLVQLADKLDPTGEQAATLLRQSLEQQSIKALQKLCKENDLKPLSRQSQSAKKAELCQRLSEAGILPPPLPLEQLKKDELIALIRQMEAPTSTEAPAVAEPVMTEDDRVHVYHIPLGRNVMVSHGHQVQAGSALTDGPINPHELLEIHFKDLLRRRQSTMEAAQGAIATVQQRLVDDVQSVYRFQGVTIDNKHIEVIVRQMTSKVRIEDAGDTTLLPGELVELPEVAKINAAIAVTGGMQAQFSPMLLGITKASLNTDSFISAASFQETTRVLTEAAIEGKSDLLRGLKENVIIGRLIPAGTGFDGFDDQLRDEAGPHPDILDDDQTGYRRMSSLRPDYTVEIPVPSHAAPVLDDPSDEQLRKARHRADDTSSAAALTRPGEYQDQDVDTPFSSEILPGEQTDTGEEPGQHQNNSEEENFTHDSGQAEAMEAEPQPMDEGV